MRAGMSCRITSHQRAAADKLWVWCLFGLAAAMRWVGADQAVIPLVYVCVAQRDGVERALRRAVYPGAYLSYYLPAYLPAYQRRTPDVRRTTTTAPRRHARRCCVPSQLLPYTRCDLTFLCPALARLTSFRKACLRADLQCLCVVWFG
jgi:hypothetical protein